MLKRLFTMVMAVGIALLLVCLASWLFVLRNVGDYPLLRGVVTPENVQMMLDLVEDTGVLRMVSGNMPESGMVSLVLLKIFANVKMLCLIGAICSTVGLIVSCIIELREER